MYGKYLFIIDFSNPNLNNTLDLNCMHSLFFGFFWAHLRSITYTDDLSVINSHKNYRSLP